MTAKRIGRNEKCPCGSGKKYKVCHGGPSPRNQQLPSQHLHIGHMPAESTKPISLTLFPGEQGRISIVPDHVPSAGGPGKYRSIVVLSRPGQMPNEHKHLDFSGNMTGDSHIAIAAPAFIHPAFPDGTRIRLETGTEEFSIVFNGQANAKGYLGKMESDPFDAVSFDDAESKAYHLIVKALSMFAAELDIPVNIFQLFVVEQSTGAITSRVNVPILETPLSIGDQPRMGAEFSYYASLYREALNSNSVVYRYLCLFKIIEGIRTRRERVIQELIRSGKEPIRRAERFPKEPSAFEEWLKSISRNEWKGQAISQIFTADVMGKKFNNIIDAHLVPLRNTVAHAILDSGELGMSSDDLLKLEKLNYWLPATRVIVRRMLRNEFPGEFLVHLPKTGDIEL